MDKILEQQEQILRQQQEIILEQQALILRQQQEIFATLRRLENALELVNFNANQQYDELNARLEINERSTRQIDEQIALANALRRDELKDLQPTLKQLQELEEFLRLNVATRLINDLEGGI